MKSFKVPVENTNYEIQVEYDSVMECFHLTLIKDYDNPCAYRREFDPYGIEAGIFELVTLATKIKV